MDTGVIIGIVIAIVAILAVLIIAGLALRRRNRISLKAPEQEQVTDGQRQVDKSGGYKAGSGFSFAQGGTATLDRKPTADGRSPGKGAAADEDEEEAAPTGLVEVTEVSVEIITIESIDGEIVGGEIIESTVVESTGVEPGDVESVVESVVVEPGAPEETAPDQAEPAAESVVETPVAAPPAAPVAPEPQVRELDEIEPTDGRLSRLRGRLARSQNAIGSSVLGLLGAGDLDEESWEEIEDTLVMADLGTAVTGVVVEELREELAAGKIRTADQARAALRKVLIEQCRPEMDRSVRALPHADGPAVVLVVGVNGVGKTTTTGKLARVLVADGRRVLLGAADTFRAAAADQLQTWGERVGAETVRGTEGADPASVAFDAVATGISEGVDVVLIDTAGRLHTKTGLMDELGKVKRVVEKKTKVDEVLLVLDATVGQNGLNQAKVFADVVDLTGVVLTKLDGTAKGGIVFRIQEELGVPVKLVGLGEGADDLAPFEPEAFVDALL